MCEFCCHGGIFSTNWLLAIADHINFWPECLEQRLWRWDSFLNLSVFEHLRIVLLDCCVEKRGIVVDGAFLEWAHFGEILHVRVIFERKYFWLVKNQLAYLILAEQSQDGVTSLFFRHRRYISRCWRAWYHVRVFSSVSASLNFRFVIHSRFFLFKLESC